MQPQQSQLASCTHPYPPVELNSDNTVELRTLATLHLNECNQILYTRGSMIDVTYGTRSRHRGQPHM